MKFILIAALLLSAATARAELRWAELSIYGMD